MKQPKQRLARRQRSLIGTIPEWRLSMHMLRDASVTTLIEGMKTWVVGTLPALNQAAYNGSLSYEALAALCNDELLSQAPPVEDVNPEQAMQVLMLLGLCGSSIERHAQQQTLRRALAIVAPSAPPTPPVTPGQGLERLLVGRHQRFIEYFQRVADVIGHPYRDSFTTYIEYNGPAIAILHPDTGEMIHGLPAGFPDGTLLTFTKQDAEVEFIRLLKECAGLQGAANLFLEQLQQSGISVAHRDAIRAALHATTLLCAIRAKMVEFMRRSSFQADFFLDILRQYACPWSQERAVRAPSGANDPTALHRDVMLFADLVPSSEHFPGYKAHVRQVCSVLMPQDVARITRASRTESLEEQIYTQLGLTKQAINALNERAVLGVLAQHPWLAAYALLYKAQKDVSHAHYGTVMHYLVKPKCARDAHADPREAVTIVANTHGTTGMDPLQIMKHLNEARARHFLAPLSVGERARQLIRREVSALGYVPPTHAQLLRLVVVDRGEEFSSRDWGSADRHE
jgi:hypothetical protein